MQPFRDEKAALERFLYWPNGVLPATWNAIAALEQFFRTATKMAFLILDSDRQIFSI